MAKAKMTWDTIIPCKLTVWSALRHQRQIQHPLQKKRNLLAAIFFNKFALRLAFWLNITICLSSVCWIVWKSPNIWHKWGRFYSKESCSGFSAKYRIDRMLVVVCVVWKYRQKQWLLYSQLCSPADCSPFLRNLIFTGIFINFPKHRWDLLDLFSIFAR